jgi:hypothetical protein
MHNLQLTWLRTLKQRLENCVLLFVPKLHELVIVITLVQWVLLGGISCVWPQGSSEVITHM